MAVSVPIEMIMKVELSERDRALLELLLKPGQGGTVTPTGDSASYFGVGGYGSQER